MKIIYIVLIFNICQFILNSGDISIDVQENSLRTIECFPDDNGDYFYGFSFDALTSGFNEKKEIKFHILTDSSYSLATCYVNPSEDGKVDTINCYFNAKTFANTDKSVDLPDKVEEIDGIPVYNWDKLFKTSSYSIIYQSICYPTVNRVLSGSDFSTYCDEGKNVLFTFGSFEEASQTSYLRNLKTDEFYEFKPTILVDNILTDKSECVFLPHEEPQNSGDFYQIQCTIDGSNKAYFFPTIVEVKDQDGNKYKTLFSFEEAVPLEKCGSSWLFLKFAGLLLLSLLLL